jgi:hypothetical protein
MPQTRHPSSPPVQSCIVTRRIGVPQGLQRQEGRLQQRHPHQGLVSGQIPDVARPRRPLWVVPNKRVRGAGLQNLASTLRCATISKMYQRDLSTYPVDCTRNDFLRSSSSSISAIFRCSSAYFSFISISKAFHDSYGLPSQPPSSNVTNFE